MDLINLELEHRVHRTGEIVTLSVAGALAAGGVVVGHEVVKGLYEGSIGKDVEGVGKETRKVIDHHAGSVRDSIHKWWMDDDNHLRRGVDALLQNKGTESTQTHQNLDNGTKHGITGSKRPHIDLEHEKKEEYPIKPQINLNHQYRDRQPNIRFRQKFRSGSPPRRRNVLRSKSPIRK